MNLRGSDGADLVAGSGESGCPEPPDDGVTPGPTIPRGSHRPHPRMWRACVICFRPRRDEPGRPGPRRVRAVRSVCSRYTRSRKVLRRRARYRPRPVQGKLERRASYCRDRATNPSIENRRDGNRVRADDECRREGQWRRSAQTPPFVPVALHLLNRRGPTDSPGRGASIRNRHMLDTIADYR
jgi:hypothetical protein